MYGIQIENDGFGNWCPDCGEPRDVCRCQEMRNAEYALEEMDDSYMEPEDEAEGCTCPKCSGTGFLEELLGDCDYCDGMGYKWWE